MIQVPAHQLPHQSDARVITSWTLATLDAKRLRQVCEMTLRLRFGTASATLVRRAILEPITPFPMACYPHDWDDLEKCEIACGIAPKWMLGWMINELPILRRHVHAMCPFKDRHPDRFVFDIPGFDRTGQPT